MSPDERAGRRAATWHGYCWGRKRSPYGPAGPVSPHPDWKTRISVPRRRRFGTADARPHPLKKVHIVREQIVATRGKHEVRWTHWLCGATTFAATLTATEPATVCAKCLIVEQKRSVDPMPRSA